MRKAKNFSNRLMAMLLSVAMIFAPIFESVPVYAEEAGTEMEGIGTMPEEISDVAVGQTGTGDANDIRLFSAMNATIFATASGFSNVGGWNESIYAEIAGVSDTDVTAVSWSGTMTGSLTGDDLTYLVRDNGNGGVRIDIPGLKAGTYTLSVTVGGQTLTEEGITVYAYDRSGYAHFNYTDGVGAYKDDGTLKDNAIVLYVTDENKNDVTVTCGSITVKGIGNILNSAGQESSGGKTSNGGKANANKGIIKKLAEAGKPLVVRFVGTVSESGLRTKGTYNMKTGESLIEGLTTYNSLDNGGSVGDNGHLARIQSGKDITLEGIGYDAVIDGWGFHYVAQSAAKDFGKSFEVRNLTFINTPEDAVGMEGVQSGEALTASVERCWIHNNEFYRPDITNPAEDDKAQGDGSVDFKKGQYYTCSYNYFERCHKTHLLGGGDEHLQYNITFHHNHYYLVESRGPLARQANIHMYNNLYEMQTFYAMNPRANAYIFSEYNMFYASQNPQTIQSGGVIKSYHDCYASVIGDKMATAVTDKTTYVQNNCKYNEFDINSQQSYIPSNDYKLDTDFTELRKVIASQTGVQVQNPKLPAEVTASDYSVIPQNATNNEILSLPQALTPSASQGLYVFTVNEAFHLEVAYEGTNKGVLVNEAGENLLTGDGKRMGLPAGTYMIQSEKIAAIADPIKWDGLTVSMLKLEAAGDPSEVKNLTFHYNYEGAPAAVTVQAKLNKSYESVETLVPEDFRRDGYKLAGLYQDANLTQPVSYPYVVSGDAVFYADWNLSEIVRVLDCINDLKSKADSDGNITGKTTINGFTIHALSSTGSDGTKHYMTVKSDGLRTNGVLLTDTSIPGNEDGLLKSIEFTTGGPAVLTVEGALSGNGVETGTYKIVLAEKSGNGSLKVVDSVTVPYDRTPINKPFDIDEAGTYYLYATGDKGVVYYKLKLTEQVYTVRYQVGTGTVPEGAGKVTAREGQEIQLPECTADPGYIFRGWSMDGGETMITSYTVNPDDAVDGLITITAYYDLISYTVKFDANGGTLPEGMEAARLATVEDTIALGDCTPGEEGGQFLGWTVNNSGNRITKSYKVNPADAVEGEDGKKVITLKATYTEAGKTYYTVKFSAEGGSLPAGMSAAVTVEAGDLLTLGECVPSEADKRFQGWSVNGSAELITSEYKVKAEDADEKGVIAIRAVYGEKETAPSELKTLTFNYNYEGAPAAVTVQANLNKSYASVELLVPAAFQRDGYKLAGLYQDANLKHPVSYPYVVSEDAVFYADWNLSEVVKVLDCINDLESKADSDGNITGKTTINGFTIHALSSTGSDGTKHYMTVRTDGLCTNGVLLTDKSISGNEDGLLKSIEFTTGGPAVLTVEGALSGNGEATGTYKLVLAEKSGNGSLKVVDSVTVPYDRTPINKPFNIDKAGTYYLYATGDKGVVYHNLKLTEQVYTVRYQVGTGTVPEGQGSITVREGEEIDLPVCTANPGYDFRGWSMDGGETMLTYYTVNPDDAVDGLITITAYYDLISYTVKFDANGGTLPEGMEATRQVTVEDTIPLGDCIPGKTGQQFLGWTVNNSGNRITKFYKVDPADVIDVKDGKELKQLITLKAVYTEVGKVYYTVKFDAGDGKLPGTMESSCLKETDDILELGECTPPTAAQQFIGWSVEGTDKKFTSSYTVNPADAKDVDGQKVITLKAVYTEAGKTYYTVKFSAEGGSLPAGMSATVTAEAGDLLTLGECASPEANKRFKGWSVNGSADPITSEYKVKAEDADGKGVIAIKAVYVEKDTGIAIIGLEDTYQYTGAKIIPNIGVVDYDIGDGRILAPGVDYSVQYKDNSGLGKAKVIVTGKGNYAGKDITQSFMIEEAENPGVELKDLKGAKLGKIDAVTYNGKAHYPNLTLTLKREDAVEYIYDETARVYKAANGNTIPAKVAISNNINKGTATILLTGANDSKDKPTKLKKTFKINAIDISKAAVDVKAQPGTYGVKAASPASITVTCNGVKLKNGTDYTVKYSANKNVTQSAKITITGKGNYTKKYTGATYTINKLDLSETGVGIKAVTAYKGMTAGKVKATVTDKDGNALKASQYTLKVYRDGSGDEESEYKAGQRLDEEEGEVYVKVFAKDGKNLMGETDIVAVNVATNITKAKIELRKVNGKVITKEYTGQAIELDEEDLIASAKGEEGEMEPLDRGTDYEIVSYSNNINKGTATAVIQGKGDYSGTKTIKFKIVGKNMKIKGTTTWVDTSSLIQGLFGSR